jgi:vacuolar-type H+-ATPase subunit F/Vma7
MSRVAVIGEPLRIYGYELAGAVLYPSSDPPTAVRALRDLPGDVAVILLTMNAAEWLADELALKPAMLAVILPEPAWAVGEHAATEASP